MLTALILAVQFVTTPSAIPAQSIHAASNEHRSLLCYRVPNASDDGSSTDLPFAKQSSYGNTIDDSAPEQQQITVHRNESERQLPTDINGSINLAD